MTTATNTTITWIDRADLLNQWLNRVCTQIDQNQEWAKASWPGFFVSHLLGNRVVVVLGATLGTPLAAWSTIYFIVEGVVRIAKAFFHHIKSCFLATTPKTFNISKSFASAKKAVILTTFLPLFALMGIFFPITSANGIKNVFAISFATFNVIAKVACITTLIIITSIIIFATDAALIYALISSKIFDQQIEEAVKPLRNFIANELRVIIQKIIKDEIEKLPIILKALIWLERKIREWSV